MLGGFRRSGERGDEGGRAIPGMERERERQPGKEKGRRWRHRRRGDRQRAYRELR